MLQCHSNSKVGGGGLDVRHDRGGAEGRPNDQRDAWSDDGLDGAEGRPAMAPTQLEQAGSLTATTTTTAPAAPMTAALKELLATGGLSDVGDRSGPLRPRSTSNSDGISNSSSHRE